VNKEPENHAIFFIFGIKHRPNLFITLSTLSLNINMIIDLSLKPVESIEAVSTSS